MKYEARNQLMGKVKGIKKGQVMSQVRPAIPSASLMRSVMTVDSLNHSGIKEEEK